MTENKKTIPEIAENKSLTDERLEEVRPAVLHWMMYRHSVTMGRILECSDYAESVWLWVMPLMQ